MIIDNLPGHPDNINRASDGTCWLALAGVRSPVWDLVMVMVMVMPGFRTRMVKRIPRDEWLSLNVNQGCVLPRSRS